MRRRHDSFAIDCRHSKRYSPNKHRTPKNSAPVAANLFIQTEEPVALHGKRHVINANAQIISLRSAEARMYRQLPKLTAQLIQMYLSYQP